MKLPVNVEKSKFFRGVYVAYDALGYVWHIRRNGQQWRGKPAPNNPARELGSMIDGSTLDAVAAGIASRRARTGAAARAAAPF